MDFILHIFYDVYNIVHAPSRDLSPVASSARLERGMVEEGGLTRPHFLYTAMAIMALLLLRLGSSCVMLFVSQHNEGINNLLLLT